MTTSGTLLFEAFSSSSGYRMLIKRYRFLTRTMVVVVCESCGSINAGQEEISGRRDEPSDVDFNDRA